MPKSRGRKISIKSGYRPKGAVLERRRHASLLARRKQFGLCVHEVDVVKYASGAEQEADQTPNKICDRCGLKIMRIGLYPPAGQPATSPEFEEGFQAAKAEIEAAMRNE